MDSTMIFAAHRFAQRATAVAAVAIVSCLAACRASMSAASDGGADGEAVEVSSSESGVDGAATICPSEAAGTLHAAPCLANCPAASTACATDGARCEYGDDPRGPTCRVTALCRGGVWSTVAATVSICEALTSAADCPSSAAADGKACGVEHSWCALAAEGTACLCTTCPWSGGTLLGPCHAGTPTWHCLARPAGLDPRCPAVQPTLGTTCTTEVSCRYLCGPGALRSCQGGVWIGTDGGRCPV